MPGRLRWDDPPCGREGFDGRAGSDWEHGPHPDDVTYSIPDEPWNKPHGPRWRWDNRRWAVTDFGLEPLYSNKPERYDFYKISAGSLLQMCNRGGVYIWPVDVAAQPWVGLVEFDAFEDAFKKALEEHRLVADDEILDRSFRRARDIMRRRQRVSVRYYYDDSAGRLMAEEVRVIGDAVASRMNRPIDGRDAGRLKQALGYVEGYDRAVNRENGPSSPVPHKS